MKTIRVAIAGGHARFLLDDRTRGLLREGAATVRRASHVEPVSWWRRIAFRAIRRCVADTSTVAAWTRQWRGQWRADLALSGGPVLEPFTRRQDAIDAEIAWLRAHRGL